MCTSLDKLNGLVAARAHQSGANKSDPLAARVHHVGNNDASNPHEGHQVEMKAVLMYCQILTEVPPSRLRMNSYHQLYRETFRHC